MENQSGNIFLYCIYDPKIFITEKQFIKTEHTRTLHIKIRRDLCD